MQRFLFLSLILTSFCTQASSNNEYECFFLYSTAYSGRADFVVFLGRNSEDELIVKKYAVNGHSQRIKESDCTTRSCFIEFVNKTYAYAFLKIRGEVSRLIVGQMSADGYCQKIEPDVEMF